jgi:hypothetical protein
MSEMKIVFFAGARVLPGTAAVNLTAEAKALEESIERTYSTHSGKLKKIDEIHDTTINDLTRKLVTLGPQIVHMAGQELAGSGVKGASAGAHCLRVNFVGAGPGGKQCRRSRCRSAGNNQR